MKVPLRWLAEFIDLPTSDVGEIRRVLEDLGHEVDGVLSHEAGWTGVVVAEVTSVTPHPDADRVRVCTVTTGSGPVTVVCGAWNFEAGDKVAFAEPGAVLPGGFRIGARTIRGVESNGMICSERELELGDDHDGILVLDADAPVGAEFASIVELPDTVIDLAITPNRPDAMSMLGIARDLSAHYGLEYRFPDTTLSATVPGEPAVGVRIEDPTGCHRFTIREIQSARIGPAPFWMRHRLRRAGVRPISNAVDVTNYVMLELGHPLHAFDMERMEGDELVVRRAADDETIVTLDGVERRLVPEADLVIADAARPTSLAGTMGGAASEVHDETSRILLEAATWDPPTIMRMSRHHGLRSEASSRFERGVDPELPAVASARAARLLAEVTGGVVVEGLVDAEAVPHIRPVIDLRLHDVERLLGPGFTSDVIADHLESIGLTVEHGEPMRVTIPGFRPDLIRAVDLVEEVARLHGYERFGDSVPTGTQGGWSHLQRTRRGMVDTLTGAGLSETIHLSFISESDLDAFALPPDHEGRLVVRVKNPLREEEALLRTTLLPQLIERIRTNRSHGIARVGLFEIGSVFFDRPSDMDPRIPDQPTRLAWAVAGGLGPTGLADPAPQVDAWTSTAILRAICARTGIADVAFAQEAVPGFHPGRSARVTVGGRDVGVIGEIHPMTTAAYDVTDRVAAAELDMEGLAAAAGEQVFRTPSTYPPVEFDLAFLVGSEVTGAALVSHTAAAAGELVESASVFDEYRALEDGRRSLAVRYVLRAPDRTLTGAEVSDVRASMIEAGEDLGATLRGST